MRKYKIDEVLNTLNSPNYKIAIKLIPKVLNIAPNTFHNYRSLKVGDKADIPYGIVARLEKLFKLREGGLTNDKVDKKDLQELIREFKENQERKGEA